MQARNWIAENWAGQLKDVLLMMTGLEFEPEIAPAEVNPGNGWIWYEQPLNVAPESPLVVAAPPAAWSEIGTRVLQAADVELVEQSAARSTYCEVLQQSLSGLARAMSGQFGVTIECAEGQETQGSPIAALAFTFVAGESTLPPIYLVIPEGLLLGLEPKLKPAATLAAPPPTPLTPAMNQEPAAAQSISSKTIDVLMDVEMPVSIRFGRAEMAC